MEEGLNTGPFHGCGPPPVGAPIQGWEIPWIVCNTYTLVNEAHHISFWELQKESENTGFPAQWADWQAEMHEKRRSERGFKVERASYKHDVGLHDDEKGQHIG